MPDKIVNHFVLADGSTAKYSAEQLAGDVPEVVDIRTGFDGTVYSSAGDAVRGQVGTLTGDVSNLSNVLDLPLNKSKSGDAVASLQAIPLIEDVQIENGHSYTYSISIEATSEQPVYFYLKDESYKTVSSITLNVGETSKSKIYTASADMVASLVLNDVNRAVSYTATISDNDQSNRFTSYDNTINSLNALVGEHDLISFTDGKYINTPSIGSAASTEMTNLNACTCFSIACNKGDIFTITGTPNNNSGTRPYMWLNANNTVVYRSEQTTAFEREEIVAPYDGTLVVNMLKAQPHEAYKGLSNLSNHVIENLNDIKDLVSSPLETMPEYITNDLAYKPLGQLQNPYLCLSCDDGSAELETYTIPMLLQKNVPCTFGLWSTSSKIGERPAFSPSVVLRSQSGINAVLSAIQNGCAVAQHGTVEWTDMSEADLNDFFDREKERFDELGITVKGAICPSHCVNNKVRAIAGGRFKSVRSGYNGFKSKADQQNRIPGDVFAPYRYSLTGARSNCYSYTSYNTIDKTLAQLKEALDYAIANNFCMIVYWHDWDLTESQKADLEAFIDYAKTTSVHFCTLDEIPTLV